MRKPEFHLLCRALRETVSKSLGSALVPRGSARISDVVDNRVRSSVLLRMAREGRVLALVAGFLERRPEFHPRDSTPDFEEALLQARSRAQQHGRDLLEAWWEVRRVLERSPALRIVHLGESALALSSYPEVHLRPAARLDLLVERDLIDEAEARLHEAAYRPAGLHRTLAWYRERHHHRMPMLGRRSVIPVAIHHSLRGVPGGTTQAALARSQKRRLAGESLERIHPVDHLIQCAVTFSCSDPLPFRNKLLTAMDVALLCGEFDTSAWETLIQRVADQEQERSTYCALFAAANLVGTSIPDEVSRTLEHRSGYTGAVGRRLRALLAHRIVSRGNESPRENLRYLQLASALLDGRGGPFSSRFLARFSRRSDS